MARPVRSRAEGLFSLESLTDDFSSYEESHLFNKRRKRIKPKGATKHNINAVDKESVKKDEPVVDKSKVSINTNTVGQEKASRKYKHFMKLFEEGKFSEFTDVDWLEYFRYKASEHNVKYIIGNYFKEQSTMKGLINRYTHDEIKTMIDFLWDCKHDLFIGKVIGVYLLSMSFGAINSVYQSALEWRDGTYKTSSQKKKELNNENKRNRNWIPQEEKPAGVKIRI